MDMREAFEKKFPLPRGLHWDEELGQYNVHPDFVFSDRSLDDKADIWNFRFEGYKTALSHIGDGSKAEPVGVREEQEAFEKFASGRAMNMEVHPLHYLFLDEQTDAARSGWRAALDFVGYTHSAPTAQDSKAEPVIYQRRQRPLFGVESQRYWTEWENCTKGNFEDIQRTPVLHDWEHQARELFAHTPTAQDSNEEARDALVELSQFIPVEDVEKCAELREKVWKALGNSTAQDSKVPEEATMDMQIAGMKAWDEAHKNGVDSWMEMMAIVYKAMSAARNGLLSAAPVPDKPQCEKCDGKGKKYVGSLVHQRVEYCTNCAGSGLQRPAAPEGE